MINFLINRNIHLKNNYLLNYLIFVLCDYRKKENSLALEVFFFFPPFVKERF